MDFDLADLDLGALFAAADAIGDKYLSAEEIAERDRKLAEALAEVNEE